MTLVERDPERAARVADFNRSRNEFYALQREHIALGTRLDEAKAQMDFDRARLAECSDSASDDTQSGGKGGPC